MTIAIAFVLALALYVSVATAFKSAAHIVAEKPFDLTVPGAVACALWGLFYYLTH